MSERSQFLIPAFVLGYFHRQVHTDTAAPESIGNYTAGLGGYEGAEGRGLKVE